MPITKPNTVPNGPAEGKNDVPGITKEPHPMQTPKDKAKAPNGVRYLASPELLLFSIVSFVSDIVSLLRARSAWQSFSYLY